ncbi:MAG: 50S ribosomal protein L22 [Nitrospirota bacterium]
MEARAVLRYIRITPRKARLVVDLIRGKQVTEAMNILKFLPKHASRIVSGVLHSAIANAEQKGVKDIETLFISKAYVEQGPSYKRFMPRAMGRVNLIKKRTSHIIIVVSEK